MPIINNDKLPSIPLLSSVGNFNRTTIIKQVNRWLDDHPEATTTVEDDSVTEAKLIDRCVTTRKIADESITNGKLADDSISRSKMRSESVGTDELVDGCVTTPKIGNGSVTAVKLSSDAVYAIPTMSQDARGVAKVGPGLSITANGALQLDGDGDISTAVQSWLDAHPEATTTVQDGSITPVKFDISEVMHFIECFASDNAPTATVSGATATASDAFAAPPRNVVVHGKTTVTGTPSTSTPATVASIDALELHAVADDWPVTIDLDGHELRSLSSTVYDELVIDRYGTVTLVQRVGSIDMGDLYWVAANTNTANVKRMRAAALADSIASPPTNNDTANLICPVYPTVTAGDTYAKTMGIAVDTNGYIQCYDDDYNTSGSATAFDVSVTGVTMLYELATPVEVPLDMVTIPRLPAPEMAVWALSTPSTTIEVTYERDLPMELAKLYRFNGSAVEAGVTDLDDLNDSGSWYIGSPNSIANVPSASVSVPAMLYVYRTSTNNWTQVFVDLSSGITYTRWHTSGGYASWRCGFDDTSLYRFNGSAVAAGVTDLDDVKDSGSWYIGSPNTIANMPLTSVNTPAMLYVYRTSTNNWTQVLVDLRSGTVHTRFHTSGGYATWRGDAKNPSGKLYAFGDSTTKGQVGGQSGVTSLNAWPNQVGRVLNMQVDNQAVGGQGLIKDWDDIIDTIDDLDMSDATLIIVAWAYNDSSQWTSIPFGAYNVRDATTYLGHYWKIMQTLQEKCPTAQVMLVTGYGSPSASGGHATLQSQWTTSYAFTDGNRTTKEMYDGLEAMCHYNGWCCVNQAKGTVLNRYNASTLIGDQIHPNEAGYTVYGRFLAAKVASLHSNCYQR